MDWAELEFFFQSLITMTAYFSYVVSIVLMVRHKVLLPATFYFWYLFDAVMNMITIFNAFFLLKLNRVTDRQSPLAVLYQLPGVASASNLLSYHMAYIQWTSIGLITVLRYCFINRNIQISQSTANKALWILLICAVPFFDTHRLFSHNIEFVYDPEQDNFQLPDSMPLKESFMYLLPFMFITSAITAVLVFLIYDRVMKLLKKHQPSQHLRKRLEMAMHHYLLFTAAIQMSATVLTGLRIYTHNRALSVVLIRILPYVSDGLSMVQPALLIYTLLRTLRRRVNYPDSSALKLQQQLGRNV